MLFIYVCLAVMWNAFAGYGGMISAGQQAFFGLGGYLAIRLSEWGVWPYPALIIAALLAGVSALPISVIVLRLRAGEFAIGMWIIAECRPAPRQPRPDHSGRYRTIADCSLRRSTPPSDGSSPTG